MSQASASSPLGSVFKTSSGGTPLKSQKAYYEGGRIPWLLSGEVAQGEIWTAGNFITPAGLQNSSAKVFPVDTVLVAMYGATAGQVGILRIEAATNQAVCGILPSDQFVPEYLYYFLLSKKDELVGKAVGNAQPNISQAKIRETIVPIVPKAQQRRIVAILDEAFEGIATAKANAEKNLQNAREVFESHLAAVFSARNKGWTDRPLHSLCRRITVGHVGSMANLYKPAGIPFLRSQNIRPFTVSLLNLVFIDEEFHAALGKSSLQAGDVAIVRTGYPGTAAVIPDSLGVANCSDLVIVRPGPEIDAHFLCAFFNSAFGKSMVSGKIVGAAQKHFNVGAAKEVVLHLPPLAEQQALVAAADELRDETDRLEGLCARRLAALDELKKALLHQAFIGAL